MIRFSPADPGDAYELQLRHEDSLEVSEGWRQITALTILESDVTAARDHEGNLVALFGLQLLGDVAVPWLLCSPLVEQHKGTLWRTARRFMRHQARSALRQGYRVTNRIPKASHGNRRFVERLGFHIVPAASGGWDTFHLPPHV